MIKAVIFDFGGVVHSLGGVGTGQRIADAYGLPLEKIKDGLKDLGIRMGKGEITEGEYWERLSARIGLPKPENYREVWHRQVSEDYKVYPEMIDLVKQIRDRGIMAIVLSNTIPPHAERIRKQGWYELFDQVYLSYEIKIRKPDKEAYLYVLKDLNLSGSDCLMIDDRDENLIVPGELGMQTVKFETPQQTILEVEEILEMNIN